MPTLQRIQRDYRERPSTILEAGKPRPKRRPLQSLRWLTLICAFLALGAVAAKNYAPDGTTVTAERIGSIQRTALTLPPSVPALRGAFETVAPEPALAWHEIRVESGDSLAGLLAQNDISASTVHRLVNTSPDGPSLAQIRPGQEIRIGRDADGELEQLVHELEPGRRVEYRATAEGFTSRVVEDPLERRIEHASGRVRGSLVAAGQAAGLRTATTLELAEIFAWDIDFALDLRAGDRFHVVFESWYRNGEHVRNGDIIAAEFINAGQRHRAVRYTDPEGNTDYYAPDGTALRRAFLRTPMEYHRVTSGFGPRKHPTLHKMREHNGVDYGAPVGTPIRSTGAGRIVERRWKGGYGRTVVIRHQQRYTTLYAHMSRFAPHQGVGSRVEQGEVIGYVGSTGRSTGPHLHYEFLVDGVHRNPQTVELPKGEPVAAAYRPHFASNTVPLLAKLETLSKTPIAQL